MHTEPISSRTKRSDLYCSLCFMYELTSQSSLMCLANVVWISVREQLSLPLEMSIKSCSEYMSSFSTKCCRSCSWKKEKQNKTMCVIASWSKPQDPTLLSVNISRISWHHTSQQSQKYVCFFLKTFVLYHIFLSWKSFLTFSKISMHMLRSCQMISFLRVSLHFCTLLEPEDK